MNWYKTGFRDMVIDIITKEIVWADFYPKCIQELKEVLEAYDEIPLNFEDDLRNIMKTTGIENRLRNEIYHILKNPSIINPAQIPSLHLKEPLDYLRKAQASWERRISKSLNSVCAELGFPLTRKRNVSEQKEIEEKWNELGADDIDTTQFRPVYAPKDFLDTLCRLRDPNVVTPEPCKERLHPHWKLIKIPLFSKRFEALNSQYHDMGTCHIHIGKQENILTESIRVKVHVPYEDQAISAGYKVLSACYAPLAREYAKRGCPQSVRGEIWCQILGVNITDKERLHYEHLKDCVVQKDLMIDKLIVKDVKLTSSNDSQYFVFEDYLHQVLLLFSRDREILNHFSYSSATPLKAIVRDKSDREMLEEVYPPNGIIPFHGFTMLVSPLCYLYDDPVKLYFVFRELYTRYLFRLHTVNSHTQGILRLSILFENLLLEQQTDLCNHFQKCGIQPLKIAFKWLMRAFSGYLPMEEVLSLWDAILAYDTLEILSVLAVGILGFRAHVLLQIHSQEETEMLLNDLTSIRVIPLILHYFSEHNKGKDASVL